MSIGAFWRKRSAPPADSDGPGQPPMPTRLMAGLAILKHTYNMSDEASDFSRIIVDTTVQPKAVMFPTDARLMQRAREKLVGLARKQGVTLRQSYERVGKYALMAHQRYAHAKQFTRANRELRKLRTFLGRVRRDILRKIKGDAGQQAVFARLLSLSHSVRDQRQKQRGKKIYSLHAPEVECRESNSGSISGFIVNRPQWHSPYGISKAVHHLTKSLAVAQATKGRA